MKAKIITIAIVLIIFNIPPFTFPFKIILDRTLYKYSNGDASFTVQDHLGKENSGIYTIKSGFEDFLKDHPANKNKILYRLFWKNPLCFWRWGEYIFMDEYKLPYKNWREIEKVRVPFLKNNNAQDF